MLPLRPRAVGRNLVLGSRLMHQAPARRARVAGEGGYASRMLSLLTHGHSRLGRLWRALLGYCSVGERTVSKV